MKIIYCLPSTFRMGGTERVVTAKANYLVTHGYEVVIITTDQGRQSSYFPLDERVQCIDLNINYEKNSTRPFLKKLFYFIYNRWLHRRRLKNVLMEQRANIVISTFFNEQPIVPKIQDGSIKILEFHFSRVVFQYMQRQGIYRWVEKWGERQARKAISRYKKFVVLTVQDADNWGNLPNTQVISNMITTKRGRISDGENRRVIAVGRYESIKGFDRLLSIWELVIKEKKDWTLHIYGKGSMRERLEEIIDCKGLKTSAVLEGESSDLAEEYAKSSIFVLTSHYEGFGMVIVEAAAAGIPTVSFDCPCGPRNIIRDGQTGFLVEDGNIKKFADKLLMLMDDVNLRREMGRRAYEDSRQYLPEVVMKQWTELFEEMVRTK